MLTEEQRIKFTDISSRNKSHLLVNEKKFLGDSGLMKQVKDSVIDLEKLLDGNTDDKTFITLGVAYQKAIDACQTYCDNKHPFFSKGKARKRMVEERLETLKNEKALLEGAREAFDKKPFMMPESVAGLMKLAYQIEEKKNAPVQIAEKEVVDEKYEEDVAKIEEEYNKELKKQEKKEEKKNDDDEDIDISFLYKEEEEVVVKKEEEVKKEEVKKEEEKKIQKEVTQNKKKMSVPDMKALSKESKAEYTTVIKKKNLVKTEYETVPTQAEIEKQQRIEAEYNLVREAEAAAKNIAVAAEKSLSIDIKKKCNYLDVLDMGNFALSEQEMKDAVTAYGSQEAEQKTKALDMLTNKIMDVDPMAFDLTSDETITKQAVRFEMMNNQLASYKRFLASNPDYEKALKNGDTARPEVMERIEQLTDISNYYRLRKTIIKHPLYRENNGNISWEIMYEDESDMKTLKEMMRASYQLAKRINMTNGVEAQFPELTTQSMLSKEVDSKLYFAFDGGFRHLMDAEVDKLEKDALYAPPKEYRLTTKNILEKNDDKNLAYCLRADGLFEYRKKQLTTDKKAVEFADKITNIIKVDGKYIGKASFEEPQMFDLKGFDFTDSLQRDTFLFDTEFRDIMSEDEILNMLENLCFYKTKEYKEITENDPEG